MNEKKFLLLVVVLACVGACTSPSGPSLTGSDVWRDHAARPFMDLRYD